MDKVNKRRLVGLTALSILLLIVLKAIQSFSQFSSVARKFDSVQIGHSRAVVVADLGKPNYHEGKCLADLGVRSDCATELVYSHPFAPLLPEYYVVELSADGHVLGTEHLVSP